MASYYSEGGIDYTYDSRGGLVPVVSSPAPVPAPAGRGGGMLSDPTWAGSLAGGVYEPTPVAPANPVADLVNTNPDAAIAKALEGPQLVTYYNELKNRASNDPTFAKQYGSKIDGLKNIIDTTAYSIAEQGGQGISAGQMAILKPLDPAILAQAKEAAKTVNEDGTTSFRGVNGQVYTVTADQKGNIQSISIPKSQGDWIATAQKDWLQANWDASGQAKPTGLSNKGNSFFGGLLSGISDIGSTIDDLVNEIPGGWATVGAIAGGYGSGLFGGAGSAGAGAAGASGISAESLAIANATSDPIAALNALQGWTTADLGYLAQIGLPATYIEQAAANNAVLAGQSPNYYDGNYTATAADTASFLTPEQLAQYGASAATIAALTGGAGGAAGAGAAGAAGSALTGSALAKLAGGLLAGGALTGGMGGGNVTMPTPSNRAGVSTGSADYSPEYYQQLQQYYNAYMPTQPKDVATPLQQWYETKFTPDANVTNKLFGV